ncbi:putative phosphonate metabolism protein [Bordetella ansorpii]|uniref:Putative phosphonate metabolism protein n=1 Tax=Bordetella ansorpii TaxID=288768 RepID=A0A157SM02_9BORD|nr:DUF1045 domain-containing protein [Bordetella ansorpii]SAI71467.1 putative phosphonate metabolism protein [Bordetella ansorpii]
MPLAYRYALYLAPAEPWRRAGAQWLGRCPDTGLLLPPSADADPRQPGWTADPRHYGLHATLKPPFRLRAGRTPDSLDDAVLCLAAIAEPFSVQLECQALRGFLAWRLAGDAGEQAPMLSLAAEAVRQLDGWRAPPTEAELARRRGSPLSPQHEAMLERWGYPYVFEHFTFHITLTGRLDGPEMQDAQARIRAFSDPLCRTPMPVRDISLYVQPEPGAPFLVARHYGFDGTVADGAAAGYLQGPAAP